MKKAYALVTGIIFALFMLLIPFTGAFADSDPGISTATFNATFGWYNGFPMVDSYGYLDINDWTITYQSNGTPSSNPSSGDVVYLYQPGDFVEISFSNWDLLSSFTTPVWCVQFGQNPSYTGNLQLAKYTLYQSYNTSECFYQYNRSFSYDNREIKWAHCFFSYPGSGVTKIRVEYDGTPVIWNAIYIKFLGYRNEPNGSTYTQADLLQLQASISSTLNLAQLADLVELDSSDVDLSTLEATTASILQKLANVPDIIQYIDQIETIDNNILSAVNNFYTYYSNQFPFQYSGSISWKKYYIDSNNNFTEFTGSQFAPDTDYYIVPTSQFYVDRIYYFRFYSDIYYWGTDINLSYSLGRSIPTSIDDNLVFHELVYYTDFVYNYNTNDPTVTIQWLFDPSTSFSYYPIFKIRLSQRSTSNFQLYSAVYNKDTDFYHRVLYYLKSLIQGNQSVPSGIQQTTDTVTEQVTDIVQFEDTYNTSLENSASQIDVSSYEIQQTQGMSFMRTYTELNFDRMQNFRILFLTPLILALAAFFLRRRS